MRKLGLILLLGLLAGGGMVGWRWREDEKLPKHDGRTLRSWFDELSRISAAETSMGDAARGLECRLVILGMGTNAVPFLVDQALSGRRDGFLRSTLQQASMWLPEKYGRKWFPPFSVMRSQAAWLIRPLQPPATLLLPLVDAQGKARDDLHRHQVLTLLGSVGGEAHLVLPRLFDALAHGEDPWIRAQAAQSIRWLGERAAGQLPTAVDLLARDSVEPSFLDWLAVLGPSAGAAVPGLERLLDSKTDAVRIRAAIALLNIQPAHIGALAAVRTAAGIDETTLPPTPGLLEALEIGLMWSPPRTNTAIGAILEPLARREMEAWTASTASYLAVRALERVDPERAMALYRNSMSGMAARHVMAGVLRLDRTNGLATQRLAAEAKEPGENALAALWAISEASSANELAVRTLEQIADAGVVLGDAGVQVDPARRARIQAARYSLMRIRFREWVEVRGVQESEW